MKLTLTLILFAVLAASAGSTYSQSARINLKMQDASLVDVFREIERTSEFGFFFKSEEIDLSRRVSIDLKNVSIEEILKKILMDNYDYRILDKNIVVTRGNFSTTEVQQGKSVSGKVTDSSGASLPGVSVVLKGTTNGTITDGNGNYSLSNVPENATIQFSFVGMKMQEVVVGGKTSINVVLEQETIGIEEVVAIGYGTQKKKLVTGATTQVKGEDIQKMNSVSPIGALQSQTPGVNIVKSSGQPGSGYNVSIRGIGTTGNSSPLYIVDGVTTNGIDNLNPSDIESLDVLKDAASAAIYGARAANGVILVTTKQGKSGKASIQYDGFYGVQNLYKKVDVLNATDYAMIMDEAAVNSGMPKNNFAALVPDWSRISNGEWNGTNWPDEITNKNAVTQNHALNVTGGTEQSVYAIGLSYTSQDGILGKPADPKYQRYTFRVNSEHKIIKKGSLDVLKVGENLNYSHTLSNTVGVGNQYSNDVYAALRTNPFLPMYDENGNYHYAIKWNDQQANPVGVIDYTRKDNLSKKHYLNGSIYFVLQPIKNLTFKSSFGINLQANSQRSYIPTYALASIVFRTEDFVSQNIGIGMKWMFENTVNYDLKLKQHNNFKLMLGTSCEKSGIGESVGISNVNSIFDDFEHAYIENTKTVYTDKTTISGNPYTANRLLSFFGRVNYDYDEKYLATVVMRADASSNFAPDKRWGYFPSVSAGWVMSKEKFLSGTSSWLNFLKLRASWGENGNQSIPPFQYLASIAFDELYFLGVDKMQGITAAYPSILQNEDITWETSVQTDLGVDAYLLQSRINLSFDWYDKRTNNWLVQAPILGIYGIGAPFINGGDVQNKGFELGLSWKDKINEFKYGINLNLANNSNKVLRIANTEGIIHGTPNVLSQGTTEFYRARVGYPIGYFWGYKTNGIFQNDAEVQANKNSKGELIQPTAKPGDLRFVNQDDSNIIDEKDKIMIGNPNPDYTFGLSFNFDYKGFDFNFVSSGVLGNQIAKSYRSFGSRTTENYTTDILGRWHGEGTSNKIPRVNIGAHINDQYISDRYIENGDYWRIASVTLGYDLKKLIKSMPFQQARMYISGQNLLTLTKYSGFDPEVGYGDNWAGGIDLGFYPSPQVFLIGASIKF